MKNAQYRELLKKAYDKAVENGDTIIYSWPNQEEFHTWENKLDTTEWFPTINAIISNEKLRAGLKISWNGFPGPRLYVATIERLHDANSFDDFADYCGWASHSGPVTLVPSMITIYP